jgi:hypothetical protein
MSRRRDLAFNIPDEYDKLGRGNLKLIGMRGIDETCGILKWIGIGAAVARRPLPHHRAYGSVHGGSRRSRLALSEQRGKASTAEVRIRERETHSFRVSHKPGTVPASGRLSRQVRAYT